MTLEGPSGDGFLHILEEGKDRAGLWTLVCLDVRLGPYQDVRAACACLGIGIGVGIGLGRCSLLMQHWPSSGCCVD